MEHILTGTDFYLGGGNPIVNLPVDTEGVTFFNLPPETEFKATSTIDPRKYYDEIYDETLYLTYDLVNSQCSTFDYNNTKNIVGSLSDCTQSSITNCQVRYGRYVHLGSNTLDSQLQKGGPEIETCSNVMMDFKNAESCRLEVDACNSAAYFTDEVQAEGDATLVCGSMGEVENDPFGQSIFHLAKTTNLKNKYETAYQKKSAWAMIALGDDTKDQLRQRVAWALSQILVITPNQIEEDGFSEMYLNYYDIFVRVRLNRRG